MNFMTNIKSSHCKQNTQEMWVLEITDKSLLKHSNEKQYLCYSGSEDWGPKHLTTNNLLEAIKFNSLTQVNQYGYHNGSLAGYECKPIRILMTISIRIP